jgi:hypothetical protein
MQISLSTSFIYNTHLYYFVVNAHLFVNDAVYNTDAHMGLVENKTWNLDLHFQCVIERVDATRNRTRNILILLINNR